jgi:adenylate cyclase
MEKKVYRTEFSKEGAVMVTENQSLLEASLLAAVPLFHVCGGQARCSTCRVLVLEGVTSLTEPTDSEKLLMSRMQFPPNVRLACQAYITGSGVKVARIIRDETDIDLYTGITANGSTQHIATEKEVALFFLDVRNFTVFVESHLPSDVIHIVRKLFTSVQAVIAQNNGKVIETAGDGLYAVFGLDHDIGESVRSAVHSGFSILEELERLNRSYFGKYFCSAIEIGIGIHEGMAIGGTIRLGNENHLVVMGYPVNIAARLQTATRELNNNFIISSAVADRLPDMLPAHQTTFVHLKGIPEPVEVHLLGKSYNDSWPPDTSNGTE